MPSSTCLTPRVVAFPEGMLLPPDNDDECQSNCLLTGAGKSGAAWGPGVGRFISASTILVPPRPRWSPRQRPRVHATFTLVTILIGNVAINVLLTLLAESLLAGVAAFLFSTVVITALGEILPQAYFSRHALRVVALLAPLLRFYQLLLWPLARPVGRLLDWWLGPEGIPWFQESELRDLLRQHARSAETEVSRVEAGGAINFLALDDLPARQEGEAVDPDSVLELPMVEGRPSLPPFQRTPEDPFLCRLEASGRKWVVLTDSSGEARFMIDAHAFLRDALFGGGAFRPEAHVHRPLVVHDGNLPLGRVLSRLTVQPEGPGDDVIDQDLILVWTPEEKRIITGSDILGRLLRGIARVHPLPPGSPGYGVEPSRGE